MASYCTQFSVVMMLPDSAAVDYALEVIRLLGADDEEVQETAEESDDSDWQALVATAYEGGNLPSIERKDENSIWIHSDETADPDVTAAIVQHLMKHFKIAGVVSFACAYTCSRPLTDAFGGSAFCVTAKEVRSMDTGNWIIQTEKEINETKTS